MIGKLEPVITADFDRMVSRALDAARDKGMPMKSVNAILATAEQLVPVREGELKESLEIIREGNIAMIGSKAPHANRIERGFSGTDSRGRTYQQPAQPYLRPAWDEHKGGIPGETLENCTNAMKEVL